MNRKDFIFQYWRHYLALEDDFIKTIRFVELDEDNFSTFSVEYNKQFQSICSEIDVICKAICSLKGAPNASNIVDYAEIIVRQYSDITSRVVIVSQHIDLKLSPFSEWKIEPDYISPQWWSEYNGVKHNRTANFKNANLDNVINSLAGLYLLEMYFLKDITHDNKDEIDIPDVPSRLFTIENWRTRYLDSTNTIIQMI